MRKVQPLFFILIVFVILMLTADAATEHPSTYPCDAAAAVQPASSHAVSGPQAEAGNWHTECVDCPKSFFGMEEHSLRLDSQGHPHVAYGGRRLYYARHDGTEWQYETVDHSRDVGHYAALALDSADRPHIVYLDPANYAVKYARYTGAEWSITTVGSGEYDIAVDVDALDHVHIAYVEMVAEQSFLKYAHFDGLDWQVETVDTAQGAISLALDQAGHPHLSYVISGTTVGYAWFDGGNWHIETVIDVGNYFVRTLSLAIDGGDRPHIVFNPVEWISPDPPIYAWREGGIWHTTDAPFAGRDCRSLTVDRDDRPHVVCGGDPDWDHLVYAWFDGGSWQSESFHTDGGAFPSLALDATGMPHISFFDRQHLFYARNDGHGWDIEPFDSSGDIGQFSVLAYNSNAGHLHVLYPDTIDGGFRYAWSDGANWQVQRLAFGRVGTLDGINALFDLALEADGRPHTAYAMDLGTTQQLQYSSYDGSAWHTETVSGAGDLGPVSLALNGTGKPHIAFLDQSALFYAYQDDTEWQISTVTSVSSNSSYVSLALDTADTPHVLYSAPASRFPVYARLVGGEWLTETVDSEGFGGGSGALALDSAGHPHVSYSSTTDDRNRLVKYANHDGTQWRIETIDRTPSGVQVIKLAVDASDHPHIVYQMPDEEVKYAWFDGRVWHRESVVKATGYQFLAPGMALDRYGRPHITYHDSKEGSLNYTRRVSDPILAKSAAPAQGLRNGDTLTFTLTVSGPGLDLRLWDPLPGALQYVPGSLAANLSPPPVYSITARAVLWQGRPPSDTAGLVTFRVTPGLTGTGSLSLAMPLVNTAWLTDTVSGFVTRATVIVNGWRFYLPLVDK
jgi:hypothetical protein